MLFANHAHEALHRTSIRAADLEPGNCMGCGRRSHTAFCSLCLPAPSRQHEGSDRRRLGRHPEKADEVYAAFAR